MGFEAGDGGWVWSEGTARGLRQGQGALRVKRRCLEGEIIGLDHEGFEVDGVGDVVGEKSFESGEITAGTVITPEEHSEIAVKAVKLAAMEAEGALAGL